MFKSRGIDLCLRGGKRKIFHAIRMRKKYQIGDLQLCAAIIAMAKIRIGNEEYLEKEEIFLPILDEGLQLLCSH